MKREFVGKEDSIAVLDGTAVISDVLRGKTFYSTSSAEQLTGTMPSNTNGANAASLDQDSNGVVVRFPYGYWPQVGSSGNGYAHIPDAQLGTATADQVLSGTSFTSSAGPKVSGTMPNNGTNVEAIMVGYSSSNGVYARFPYGYYSKTGHTDYEDTSYVKMTGDQIGTVAAGMVVAGETFTSSVGAKLTGTLPKNSNGATAISVGHATKGTYAYFNYGYWPADGQNRSYIYFTEAQIGGATQDDVLSSKKFTSHVGANLSGSMTNNGTVSKTLSPGGSYTIAKGYHSGSGKVTASAISTSNLTNGGTSKSESYEKTFTYKTTEAYTACIIIAVANHGIEGDGTLTVSTSSGTVTSMRTDYTNRGSYGTRTSIYKGANIASGATITLTDSVNMSGVAIYIIKAS